MTSESATMNGGLLEAKATSVAKAEVEEEYTGL